MSGPVEAMGLEDAASLARLDLQEILMQPENGGLCQETILMQPEIAGLWQDIGASVLVLLDMPDAIYESTEKEEGGKGGRGGGRGRDGKTCGRGRRDAPIAGK